jgi:hypothetical protein
VVVLVAVVVGIVVVTVALVTVVVVMVGIVIVMLVDGHHGGLSGSMSAQGPTGIVEFGSVPGT